MTRRSLSWGLPSPNGQPWLVNESDAKGERNSRPEAPVESFVVPGSSWATESVRFASLGSSVVCAARTSDRFRPCAGMLPLEVLRVSLLGNGGAGRGRIRSGGPAPHQALFRLLPVGAEESWLVAILEGRRCEVDHPGVVESAGVVPGLDAAEVGAEEGERGGDALPGLVAYLREQRPLTCKGSDAARRCERRSRARTAAALETC